MSVTSAAGIAAKPADRAMKAGRLLEEVLQNACDGLSVSVPFRIRGDYTIEPLWAGFRKRSSENKGFSALAGATVHRIEGLRAIRNWVGAHWNEWAQQLSDKEASDFADAVVSLRGFLYCEECRRFVIRIAQLDGVWSCPKEHKRYDHKP